MPEYCIQAAMFQLPVLLFNRFVHNYWILRDVKSNAVVAQLHGLATSRKTGRIVPIGYSRDHSLKAHCITYDVNFATQHGLQLGSFALPIHACYTVYKNEDCIQHWLRIKAAVEVINNLDLDYPRGGFKVPLSSTVNSNSIYHTFSQVMGIPMHSFEEFFQIGIQVSIYERIKDYL
ncbi:hypothetical protein Lgra_0739 [Legionella gratiana]|uniref:Uncharacterized protein n=1 Tax=Legionella gratiana TaxID=45066 RepID=A0A378JFM0_9GAMM|nr:hypothetical protein [Legionella gratiana]KTD14129.1 hypothetical protein Lgra_0739 [Legionella gratiana]STX46259.1 Uncharacterised protein [Legionella gratiana]